LITGSLSQTLVGIGKGMAANSAGLLGGRRSHDESSESQSAISDSIMVNAGHITGSYSRDVAHANGVLMNKFDAQKLQNQIQVGQLGTQLVGEIVGTALQKVQDQQMKAQWNRGELSTVPGPFSALEIGRDLLEAGGAAGVAALTGGNAVAAGVGTLSGNVMAAVTRDWTDSVATNLAGNSDGKLHDSLANLFSGIIAAAGGTVGGLIASDGDASVDALTGAAAAAAIEQYNAAAHKTAKAMTEAEVKAFYRVIEGLPADQAMRLWESAPQGKNGMDPPKKMERAEELMEYARSQGMDIRTLMATFAAETTFNVYRGRRPSDPHNTIEGLGQMSDATFKETRDELVKRLPWIASKIAMDLRAGKQDPFTEGVVTLEFIRNLGIYAQKVLHISDPTFEEIRPLYEFGKSGGYHLSKAIHNQDLNQPMRVLVRDDFLYRNKTPPQATVRDWLIHVSNGTNGVGKDMMRVPVFLKGK
ncbi:hypothetical protein J3T99_05145, partial [Acetobacteraceae bacterium B3987]|nr:hypothetical protein [Acetobacteraceae bacterium B3987]